MVQKFNARKTWWAFGHHVFLAGAPVVGLQALKAFACAARDGVRISQEIAALTLPTPKGGDSYEELTEASFTRKGFAKSPLATRSNSSLWLLLRNMSLSQFTECVNRKDSPNGERLISPSLKLGVLRRI